MPLTQPPVLQGQLAWDRGAPPQTDKLYISSFIVRCCLVGTDQIGGWCSPISGLTVASDVELGKCMWRKRDQRMLVPPGQSFRTHLGTVPYHKQAEVVVYY